MKIKSSLTQRPRAVVAISIVALSIVAGACTTLPDPDHPTFFFPKKKAFVGKPNIKKEFETLGLVKARVNFSTIDFDANVETLCKNYYNSAVEKLAEYAEEAGGNAVMQVRSVVFYMDGKSQLFQTPQCSNDGAEGQILAQGIAIRWKK